MCSFISQKESGIYDCSQALSESPATWHTCCKIELALCRFSDLWVHASFCRLIGLGHQAICETHIFSLLIFSATISNLEKGDVSPNPASWRLMAKKGILCPVCEPLDFILYISLSDCLRRCIKPDFIFQYTFLFSYPPLGTAAASPWVHEQSRWDEFGRLSFMQWEQRSEQGLIHRQRGYWSPHWALCHEQFDPCHPGAGRQKSSHCLQGCCRKWGRFGESGGVDNGEEDLLV